MRRHGPRRGLEGPCSISQAPGGALMQGSASSERLLGNGRRRHEAFGLRKKSPPGGEPHRRAALILIAPPRPRRPDNLVLWEGCVARRI